MKKKFILYLIFAMVCSNMLLTIVIGNYVGNKIDQIVDVQKKDIIFQSKEKIFTFDKILLEVDRELKEKMEKDILKVSKKIEEPFKKKDDFTNDVLKKIAEEFPMYQIYIINEEGTIVYTTFPQDQNLNIFQTGETFEKKLKSLYGKEEIKNQSITASSKTGILNKYIYYSPKESNYIIEISVNINEYIKNSYPKGYDEFVFSRLFQSIAKENKYLVGIDIYGYNKIDNWSLLHSGKKFGKNKVFMNKLKKEEEICIQKGKLQHCYHSFSLDESYYDFTRNFYVELIYDFSTLEKNRKDIFLFSLGVSFFIIFITFFIASTFFNTTILSKIATINYGLKMIEKGNYDYNIEIDANDELGDITNNVNKMKEIIKKREEELMQQQNQIHYLAYYDKLTGLPNRTLFEEKLARALEEAEQQKQKVALLYFDLDNFKNVNDTIGHMFGDLLLKNVGRLLEKYLGEDATATRMGGDEFVAILPKANDVQDIIDTVKHVIKAFQNPWIIDDREFYVTTSIGITLYPDDGINTNILLKNADTAMYVAKSCGKNMYHFYTSDMNEKLLEKLEMENSLRHAVDREEFVVYYQPKINTNDKSIAGVEALVRWNHPTNGMIPPNMFIPLAEEMRLIVPMGQWVLRNACKQNQIWKSLGCTDMSVAVNISVIQIQQSDFVQSIIDILEETGMQPSSLELEITENIIMKDFEFTNKILHDLRKLGIRISLDDFGKGYSSLNYLRQLEIDILKIDKSFIDDLTKDHNEQAIVKSVIDMAHSMKMTVIAEGVETWEQFTSLKSLHCDKVQGYLFSRPLPVNEIEHMIEEQEKVC
ncbi:EAL domain-containing protein [Marinisporobacter balticus]|uniref:Diguanylate cyclase (GGDEF)-like protein n=1 Tax=Marinisporobacter balticus TaxID=2018667 RepID=A0A4R2KL84_9FIRM|nr:EAL domain-containing protein [Marinisporobacter balticus]TCO74423.1 diguanylate cyclase (GGDEF)-like protein [Marinisporobacter balticus]